MYTKESVKQLIQVLDQKMHQTLREKNYKQAGVFGQALDQLTAWLGQGQPGPLPQEIQEIPDLHWQSILQEDVPSASPPAPVSESISGSISEPDPESSPALPLPDEMPSEPAASAPTPPAPARPSDRPSLSPEIEEGLAEISRLISQGNLVDARAQLEVLTGQALSPQDQQIIEGQAAALRAAEGRALTQAREHAQSMARNQPDNYAGQQEAWRAVQRLDPGNQEAANALAILSSQILAQSGMNEIREIRRRLPELRRKISLVEEARRRVNEMRYDSAITDPAIQSEVEKLYTELDDARNAILRASDGATGMERAAQYESAIQIYRNAIRQGLTEIVDDVTGDPIVPQERLTATLRKYWDDLIKRSSQRYADAEKFLQGGVPEVAREKLEEAQALLGKVEDGGDEWRRRVEEKLEETRISLMRKGEADALVRESDTTPDPQHARALLLEAQDKYPRYPRLADRIRHKEEQILEQAPIELEADLQQANRHLDTLDLDEARRLANQIVEQSQLLHLVDPAVVEANPQKAAAFQTIRKQAEELRDRIAQREQRILEYARKIEKERLEHWSGEISQQLTTVQQGINHAQSHIQGQIQAQEEASSARWKRLEGWNDQTRQQMDGIQTQIKEIQKQGEETQQQIKEIQKQDKETQQQIKEIQKQDKETQKQIVYLQQHIHQIQQRQPPLWMIPTLIVVALIANLAGFWFIFYHAIG